MSIRDGKLLYHLTTLDVFESIVKYGLLSREALKNSQLDFVDTANHDILKGRERLNLEDYIPFHFHIHTSYDTYVKDNNKDKKFIYLCLHRNYARSNNFSILPIHPTSVEKPKIYPYDEGINIIDWDIMELNKSSTLPYGKDERYRTQVRMAECLSPKSIPIDDFLSICVKDDYSKTFVENILNKYKIKTPPYINICSYMF